MIPYRGNPFGVDFENPLTFTAAAANSSVSLVAIGSPTVSGLQYRRNFMAPWMSYTPDTTVTLSNIGDYVQFRNTETTLSSSRDHHVRFVMTGLVSASGNIMSMLNYSASCSDYCFYELFAVCNQMITAPEMPAMVLAPYCYLLMYYKCSGLVSMPELPATTLAAHAYDAMFWNCTGLTSAYIPASTLASSCLESMFYGCSSLSNVRVEFTSWTGTVSWLGGVAASGTFTKPAALPEERGANRIPENWTVVNT